jgi:hypothetical protein
MGSLTSFLTAGAGSQYGEQNFTRGQHGQLITIVDAITHLPINTGCDIMNFEWNPTFSELNPLTITGPPRPLDLPEMCIGSWKFLRYDGSLEQMFSDLFAQFYQDGSVQTFNITQTVMQVGAPTKKYQFMKATLKLGRVPYNRDGAVEIDATFRASTWSCTSA